MAINALRIDGDDLTDLVLEMERSFAVYLGRELLDIITAGDLADAVWAETCETTGAICPTQRTFYRLRATLVSAGVPRKASPQFGLAQLRVSPRHIKRLILEHTNLVAPAQGLGWIACMALLMTPILAALSIHFGLLWGLIPIVASGFLAMKADQGFMMDRTLGDLARRLAAGNHAALAREAVDIPRLPSGMLFKPS